MYYIVAQSINSIVYHNARTHYTTALKTKKSTQEPQVEKFIYTKNVCTPASAPTAFMITYRHHKNKVQA